MSQLFPGQCCSRTFSWTFQNICCSIKPRITHYLDHFELDLNVRYGVPWLTSWHSEKHTTHILKECSSAVQRDSKNRVFGTYRTNYPYKISLFQPYQYWMFTDMTRAFQKCIGDFLWTGVGGFMGLRVAKMGYFGHFASCS